MRGISGCLWLIFSPCRLEWASQVAQWVKNLPAVQETQEMWVWSLGWEDPLEEGLATHSSILAWRIPWMSLMDCNPQCHKELDTTEMTEHTHTHTVLSGKCFLNWPVPGGLANYHTLKSREWSGEHVFEWNGLVLFFFPKQAIHILSVLLNLMH